MNIILEFISHGLHQIQRTFFPDLEQEAGPIPETLVRLTYILETVQYTKTTTYFLFQFHHANIPFSLIVCKRNRKIMNEPIRINL